MLAESYAGGNNSDACRVALIRATLLMLTVTDSADYDRRIKDIATKQKIEALCVERRRPRSAYGAWHCGTRRQSRCPDR